MHRTSVPFVVSLTLASLMFTLVFSVAIRAQDDATSRGFAQNIGGSPENGQFIRKIVAIKYADVAQLASILKPLGTADGNRDMKVITIGGSPEAVAAMEDAIKRLDVPPAPVENIELTAYLLVASGQDGTKKTPTELDGVIKQLRGVFPYQGYRLMDTLMVRCRNGRDGVVNGIAPSEADDVNKTIYELRFRSVTLIPDNTGKRIRVDGLRLGAKIPIRTSSGSAYIDTGINTELDIREGQKVVVGKATVDSSNNALFLVLTARVVD